MDLRLEYWAQTEQEWNTLWLARPTVGAGADRHPLGGSSSTGDLPKLASYLGSSLYELGFTFLRNAGAPILVRDVGAWRQEIVLRPGPRDVPALYVPVEVHIHLTNEAVGEMRRNYLVAPAFTSNALVSANLGQLSDPPGWVLWNVSEYTTFERILESLFAKALPWLDLMTSAEAYDAIRGTGVKLMDPMTALEWVTVTFGKNEGRLFLESHVLSDPLILPDFEATWLELLELRGKMLPPSTLGARIALAAWSLELRPMRSRPVPPPFMQLG